jgi:hypothetical protein
MDQEHTPKWNSMGSAPNAFGLSQELKTGIPFWLLLPEGDFRQSDIATHPRTREASPPGNIQLVALRKKLDTIIAHQEVP